MFSTILRSRIASIANRSIAKSRSLCSNPSSINPPKIRSLSAAAESSAPPREGGGVKKSLSFVKYCLVGALTGATCSAGYATYAYSADEIVELTKPIRAAADYMVPYDAPVIDRVQGAAYSTAMSVSARAIDLYLNLRRQIEEHVQSFAEPTSSKLLPDLHPMEQHIFTIVLDLNETLICTDWKRERGWHTFKRPGVDAFLEHLSKFCEIVLYSDEPSMFVGPVVERLDSKQCIHYTLSRDATKYQNGKHYKDLSALNRDPAKIIYISGHALETTLQPENSIQIKPWKLEADDTALVDLIPFLEYVARNRPTDIRETLKRYDRTDVAKQFLDRFREHQEQTKLQQQKPRLWRR